MTRPIILGNAPSAGSSLLRVMLQRHQNIAGRGEVAILDKPGLYEESPASFKENIGRWLDRGYQEVYLGGGSDLFTHLDQYPWTPEELRDFCISCASFPEMVEGFFAHNSRVWGRPRWLEKTPPNVYCFRQIREIFPEAQFIQIVRDARDARDVAATPYDLNFIWRTNNESHPSDALPADLCDSATARRHRR